jgi:hypothetical protein
MVPSFEVFLVATIGRRSRGLFEKFESIGTPLKGNFELLETSKFEDSSKVQSSKSRVIIEQKVG